MSLRGSVPRAVAVAVTTGLALASGWGVADRTGPPRGPKAAIDGLVQAAAGRRLLEGRLSGGFFWAPEGETPRGSAPAAGRSEDWRIAAVASRVTDPHALGLAHLLLGGTDEAVASLEAAADDAPEDAAVLSDLAAALIARGALPAHPQDLVRALDLCEQALAGAPDLEEAWFNRALAVERLNLREAAVAAWEEYLRHDQASPWADEARARATRLRDVPGLPRWEDDAPEFTAACERGDRERAEVLLRRHPQQANEAILQALLPGWARNELAGESDRARAALDALGCAGQALARATGDFLVADAVEEIRESDRRAYAVACSKLVLGRARLDALDAAGAQELLREAKAALPGRSALANLVELNALVARFYLQEPVDREVTVLAERARHASRGILEAKARWLEGLALYLRGEAAQALPALQQAREGLDRIGFTGDATFVRSLEASAWRALGRTERAWAADLQVFAQLDGVPDARRAQAILGAGAAQTEEEGFRLAAIVLQQAALAFAGRHDSAADRCDGQIWLARVAARAGRTDQAERALGEARTLLLEVDPKGVGKRQAAEIALIEAGLLARRDPPRGQRQASAASDYFERAGILPRVVESRLARARADQAAGQNGEAEKDFQAALAAVEAQRSSIVDPAFRLSSFEAAADLARELVEFTWSSGDGEKALLLADRMRARTLLEARHEAASRPSRIQEVSARLDPAEAVLFYAVLEERTVLWVLRRSQLDAVELDAGARELHRLVRAWRTATRNSDRGKAALASGGLFTSLVKPVQDLLKGVRTVAIVPDGPLHGIGWASLRDPRSGRPWAEHAAIAVAPCLPTGTVHAAAGSPSRALVVGNPAFDRRAFADLPDLPGAAREAVDVASVYADVTLLTGAEATADRLLAEAERADVLHVAAHGLVDALDETRSALVLAPGGDVAPGGALLPAAIRQRRLDRMELVVLAACRSGDGRLSQFEGPLSLARPFLEAGAGAVLVSLFDLPDRRSAVASLHAHLRKGHSPLEAFRRTTVECWSAPSADPLICGGLQLIVHPANRTGGD